MNRSRSRFLVVSLLVLLPLASGVLWSTVTGSGASGDSLYKYLSIFSEVFNLVHSNYVDPTQPEKLLAGAIDGVGDALDPFSAVIPAGEMADYERAEKLATPRSGLVLVQDHGVTFVAAVEPESPGAKTNIVPGDIVAEVDGQETREMPLWKIERRLAGDPGSAVHLRLVREGETHEKKLVLADFTPPPPRITPTQGFPMLTLTRIAKGADEQIKPLLEGLTKAHDGKLLVDLRGIADGDMDEAYKIGALFAQGDLGRLDQRGKSLQDFRSDAAPVWKGQLAVLVNGGTLGAAEVLASILQQGAGAKLVGVQTFGWAGRRSYIDLSAGARVHLTTAFYTGPNDKPISDGLAPDELVDDLSRTYGEADRPLDELILDRGVELLRGAPFASRRAA